MTWTIGVGASNCQDSSNTVNLTPPYTIDLPNGSQRFATERQRFPGGGVDAVRP